MIELSPAQVSDLAELAEICSLLRTEVVVIGAVAYATFVDDANRHTGDVDVAVALDMDDFQQLRRLLAERNWTQRPQRENRWYGPRGGIVDIIPAGSAIRAEGQIIWPESQMRMSVVGFDHVFEEAEWRELAPAFRMKVVPLPVLTLLKIISYLDRPEERERDIRDVGELLKRYERDNDDRRFSDEIIDRQIEYGSVGAFLLGMDLGAMCSETERVVVAGFVAEVNDETSRAYIFLKRARLGFHDDDEWEPREEELKSEIAMLEQGFRHGCQKH